MLGFLLCRAEAQQLGLFRKIWHQVNSLKQVCSPSQHCVQGEAEARGVPVSRVGSRSKAPVRPVSSSTVKRHSRGGSGYSGQAGRSSRASAVATPMPLSAPSVVPSAYTGVPAWGGLDTHGTMPKHYIAMTTNGQTSAMHTIT